VHTVTEPSWLKNDEGPAEQGLRRMGAAGFEPATSRV
jgi:hypothetical protein